MNDPPDDDARVWRRGRDNYTHYYYYYYCTDIFVTFVIVLIYSRGFLYGSAIFKTYDFDRTLHSGSVRCVIFYNFKS